MRFLPVLMIVLCFSMAYAQEEKKHPLAETSTKDVQHPWATVSEDKKHPLADVPDKTETVCKDYVVCQIEGLDALEFRSGAFFSKKGYCTTCDQQSYNTNIRWFLDHGYEIINTSFEGTLARVQLHYKE